MFNALKHGYGHHSSSSSNNNYVNLSHQSRAEYLRHLELIDLQLDLPKLAAFNRALKNLQGKKKSSEHRGSSDSSEPLKPPQTLRDIFRISNTNRKKNKQRKKSKLENYANQSSEPFDSANPSSSAAPPPATVHQIIQFQYKHDA